MPRLITVYDPDHMQHDPVPHPEMAARALIIHQAVQAADLGPIIQPLDFGLEPILALHTPNLVTFLQEVYQLAAADRGEAGLVKPADFAIRPLPYKMPRSVWGKLGLYCSDIYTPVQEGTWRAAYQAVQATLTAANEVINGAPVAYALCRPPGHHAYANMYGGYCYLNNAAIAAAWLAEQGRRPAILDIDYHHGNGTQSLVYGRGDVFFCSIHADPSDEYPFYAGYADETGEGDGAGATLNLPLPVGTGPASYLQAVDEALDAIARFQTDILLISLGLDAYIGDPVGGFKLRTETFFEIGERCRQLALPLLVVQEGGYLLEKLGQNAVSFLRGASGQ